MKQNATIPSLQIGEGQSSSSLEWSSQYVITKEHSSTLELPTPPSLSPEARRVSTDSINSSTSSSISSSSSSSSFGFGSYDEPDDINSEKSTNDEDDPIISFETLSLETRRIGASPVIVARSEEGKQKLTHQRMNRLKARGRMKTGALEQRQESPPKTLHLQTLFSKQDAPSRHLLQETQSVPSFLFPKKKLNALVAIDGAREEPLAQPEQEHRRSLSSRKYTIRKNSKIPSSNSSSLLPVNQTSKAVRQKRQRGGSDFSMVSEGGVASLSSPTDRRKRRRMNRNRAMAADDFDSILSQINTTGSLPAK
eukprot:jgi/Psemu1/291873/fgenesh1_pg.833_\